MARNVNSTSNFPVGTGTSLFTTDVVGVLTRLVPREGTYEYNGETRPQSWTAFLDTEEGERRFSWSTYTDKSGKVQPWSRFDPSIDLAKCAAERTPVHLWRDDQGRQHLELA